MKRNNIFVMMAASLLMLLGSCSEEMELDRSREDASSASYAVRFTLGGSAGEVLTRGGGEGSTITAEADEKKVAKLYAVVFKDSGKGAVTGQNGKETNSETFYKVIDVLGSGGGEISDKQYKFEVGEPGHYQIFFVANPSDQLKTAIEALKGEGQPSQAKTVSDFKKLQETTQAPEAKPMLMTSIAYGATVDAAADVDLGTVELTRAESRIDLVNQAPGVKITKVVFKNRAKGTVLIADSKAESTPSLEQSFKENKTYDNLSLTGSTAGVKYEHYIYSYEQYGTNGDAPSMDITYEIAQKSYTHKVDFKTAAPKSQQISLKRNTVYKVTLENASGKLSLELTVADWDKGEEFTVSSQDLKYNVSNDPDYSTAALGDFMLKDGTLIKSSDKDFNTKKAQAIGVVALLYKDVNKDRIGTEVAKALNTKGVDKVHGLVLALKNASTDVSWGPTNAAVGTTYDELGTVIPPAMTAMPISRR